MSIINFTVEYDLFSSQTDSTDVGIDADLVPLIGTVTFTPQVTDDKAVLAPSYTPRPAGFKLMPFVGYLDSDGQLKSAPGGEVGVRLWANDPVLELDRLTYKVDFNLRTSLGAPVTVDGGYFEAPATDGTINLTDVLQSTGVPSASVVQQELVYSHDIVDATDVGIDLITAADAESARGSIDAARATVLVAPPPSGDRATDTAAIQALVDEAQTTRGTVVLQAGTYKIDIVTSRTDKQPRIVGQGKRYTEIDGTIKFKGQQYPGGRFSGGYLGQVTFVGSHAGEAALELNGVCDVHWDEVRIFGTYDVGILFWNELYDSEHAEGSYTEVCNGVADFYASCKTAVEYRRTDGSASFHNSGLLGGRIQQPNGYPAVLIGADCRPYNAPMSVQVWHNREQPIFQHNGHTNSNFYGNLTQERGTDGAGLAQGPIASGNKLYYAGTVNTYLASGLTQDYGTLLIVPSLAAVSGVAYPPIGPMRVGDILDYDGNKLNITTTSRLVCTTASGGTGAENGANTWAKIATISTGSNQNSEAHLSLHLIAGVGSVESATITVGVRSNTTGVNPQVSAFITAKSNVASIFQTDSFKMISGAFGTDAELWMKKGRTFGKVFVYELARSTVSTPPTITYNDGAAWQSTEPVGAVNNVSTAGVTAFGVPVVTTTGLQTLTEKTLTTPTLTTPVINGQSTGTGVASANTVSTLVQRDGSGNFSAGTITATLSGNASTATNLVASTSTVVSLGSIEIGNASDTTVTRAAAGVIAVEGVNVVTRTVQTVTTSTTLGSTGDYIVFIGSGGAPTLPTAVGNTSLYRIKNTHNASRTISTTSSQTIEGASSLALPTGDSVDLVSDGSNWRVI